MNQGMIAPGNHWYFDSLRDAPPSLNVMVKGLFVFCNNYGYLPQNTCSKIGTLREGQRPSPTVAYVYRTSNYNFYIEMEMYI